MRYALLIYTAEPTAQVPEETMTAQYEGYNAFTAHIRERGAFEAGEALESISTATTVRVRDGRTLTTDGPFAETKEALVGFYLVEAADLDQAIAYAAMIPGAQHGSIEVRPIYEYSGAAVEAQAVGAARPS